MSQAFISQDFRFGLLASIKDNTIGAVYLISFYPERLRRPTNGLINAYAKDILLLPEWRQRPWAGFNISPEGGVSDDLFDAQVKGIPAKTQAPGPFLQRGIEVRNQLATDYGQTRFPPVPRP